MSNSEHDNPGAEDGEQTHCSRRGFELAPELRNEAFAPGLRAPQNRLMRHLMTLQRLHPEVVRFREAELEEMDDNTLEDLIEDFSEALGIKVDIPSCL